MAVSQDGGLALIAFRCSSPTHERVQPRETSTLTFHRDGWAYCPAPAAGTHRWTRTGGVPLRELLIRPAGPVGR